MWPMGFLAGMFTGFILTTATLMIILLVNEYRCDQQRRARVAERARREAQP